MMDAFDAALRRGDLEGCVAAVRAPSNAPSDSPDDRWVGARRMASSVMDDPAP